MEEVIHSVRVTLHVKIDRAVINVVGPASEAHLVGLHLHSGTEVNVLNQSMDISFNTFGLSACHMEVSSCGDVWVCVYGIRIKQKTNIVWSS